MQKSYPIIVEVAAELGMFARPDTGSEPFSYPLPTATAARGMIESILRILGTEIKIIAIGTCNTPQ